MLIFVLFLFIAVICPARNFFAIDLTLLFGGVTLPFAKTFSKWLTYLRYHENNKLAAVLNVDRDSAKWVFFDPGTEAYTWMFRLMSGITAGFSIYHLAGYIT
jgi:hypothetical protein